MNHIEYRIMGVPSRMVNTHYLQKQLNITDSDTFIDTEYRHNPMWTWKQTVKLPIKKETTHLCIVQDDAVLCNKFTDFTQYLVNRFPEAIWMMYNRSNYRKKLPLYCIFNPNYCSGGVSFIVPVKYIENIISCQEKEYPDYIHDDNWITYWAYKNSIPVYSTYPTVVSTLETVDGIKSELNHEDGRKPDIIELNPLEKHWANATNFKYYKNHKWVL